MSYKFLSKNLTQKNLSVQLQFLQEDLAHKNSSFSLTISHTKTLYAAAILANPSHTKTLHSLLFLQDNLAHKIFSCICYLAHTNSPWSCDSCKNILHRKVLHSSCYSSKNHLPHTKKLSMHQLLFLHKHLPHTEKNSPCISRYFLQEHLTHMNSPCSSCYACKNILHVQKNSPWQMTSTQRLKSPATLNTSIISPSFPQKTFRACLSPKQHARLFRVWGNIVQHTPLERSRVVPKPGQTSSFMSQILQSF